MANEVVGAAIIEIQPDFSRFEAELTRGLRDAVQKAQRAAQVDLKVDGSAAAAKNMQKSFSQASSTSDDLNAGLREMNRTLQETNKSILSLGRAMRVSEASGSSMLQTFSTLVLTVANLSNVARGFTTMFDIGKALKTNFLPFVRSLDETSSGFSKARTIASEFFRTVGQAGQGLPDAIKKNKQMADSVNAVGKSADNAGRTILNLGKKVNPLSKATKDQAKVTDLGTNSAKLLRAEVQKTGGVWSWATGLLSRFKSEQGAVNLSLLNGSAILNTVRGGFSGIGAVAQGGAAALGKLGTAAQTATGAITRGAKAPLRFFQSVKDINKASAQTSGVLDRMNTAFLSLSRGIAVSSDRFAALNLAGKMSQKLFKLFAIDLAQNADQIAAAALRANSALGGALGGPKFALAMGSTIGLVTTLTGVLTAGSGAIILFAQKASSAAESLNAVAVTLGKEGAAKFTDIIGDPTEIGLSGNKLRTAITPIVPLLKNAGLTGEELATSLADVTKRGVDLSSIFNVDVTQAIGAISAGIRGEIEPLERLGVAFNAAEVESKAMSLGFEKVDGQLSESHKQFARLQIIMEKSQDVEGDFENTSTSLANAQRILGAKMDDIAGKISTAFLPAAQKLVQTFIKLAEQNGPKLAQFFQALSPLLVRFADLFGSLAQVASSAGGIFTALLLPTMKAFAGILAFVTPALTAFLTRFFVVTTISMTLKIFAAVLALLPMRINGLSVSVATLSTSVASLLRPLAIGMLAMSAFGVASENSSQTILGGFGRALKTIEPLLRFFLFQFVAMRAIPLIITSINYALTSLHPKLALSVGYASALKTSLSAMIGPIGLLVAAISTLTSGSRDAAAELERLKTASIEVGGVAKEVGDQLHVGSGFDVKGTIADAGLWTTTKAALKNVLTFSDRGVQDLEKLGIKKRIKEVYEADPELAKGMITALERVGDDLVPGLKTTGTKLAKIATEEFNKLGGILDDQVPRVKMFVDRVRAELATLGVGASAFGNNFAEVYGEVLEGIDTELNPFAAATAAQKGYEASQGRLTGINAQINELTSERAALLADTGRSAREEAEALERIRKINVDLRELAQERRELAHDEQRRLEEVAPTLAGFEDRILTNNMRLAQAKRAVEEAQKAINVAVEEGIIDETVTVNLAGLSLDQMRSKLANVRMTLAAQKSAKKLEDKDTKKEEKPDRTPVEIQEDILAAQIALREVEREAVDLPRQKAEFIRESGIAQREYGEKVVEIGATEKQLRRDLVTTTSEYQKLLKGETGVKKEIAGLTKQIADQEKLRGEATAEVRDNELAVMLANATAKGDIKEILRIKSLIAKETFNQVGHEQAVIDKFEEAVGIVDRLAGKIGALQDKVVTITINGKSQIVAPDSPIELAKTVAQALRDGAKSLAIAADLSEVDQRNLQELAKHSGFSFATLAQGGIFEKAQHAVIGEAGREVVLPLTRPSRLRALLGDPTVLPPVLAALAKIRLPRKLEAPLNVPEFTAPHVARRSAETRSAAQEAKRDRELLARSIASEMVAALTNSAGDKEIVINQTVQHPDPAVIARLAAREVKRALESL